MSATTTTSETPAGTRRRPDWAVALDPYSRPRWGRSLLDVATSIVPYLTLSVVMYLLLDVSYWLVLAVAVPAAGFLLRTFIVFHDCTHGSFLPSRKWNNRLGVLAGLLVMHPFHNWRHHHVAHHGSAGDLDRRGTGDVPTLTVEEYRSRSWSGRLGYWLFRHPLVMFGIGPLWSLVIGPRFMPKNPSPAMRRSVIATNLALAVAITAICLAIGWQEYLLVQAPTVVLAGTAGVWLFYVQHQFEDVYWESSENWSYADAALKGSSYLRLPQPLQFFTGNIGLHHVHHLNARIPNYMLQRAHDENEIFHDVPVLTFWDGIKSVRLKLWDEERGRLVTFAEARRSARGDMGASPAAATQG
jgi:acyl-lipid omega-6 desaturase (Delta-12 desaturase)